jgi:hypothetical protein
MEDATNPKLPPVTKCPPARAAGVADLNSYTAQPADTVSSAHSIDMSPDHSPRLSRSGWSTKK